MDYWKRAATDAACTAMGSNGGFVSGPFSLADLYALTAIVAAWCDELRIDPTAITELFTRLSALQPPRAIVGPGPIATVRLPMTDSEIYVMVVQALGIHDRAYTATAARKTTTDTPSAAPVAAAKTKGQGDTKKGQKKRRALNDRARMCLNSFNRKIDGGGSVTMAQHCREFCKEADDSDSIYRTLKDWSKLWHKPTKKGDTKRDKVV